MIEPQNTTIPRAAESRSGEAPQDDVVGFGEMLAQSLGSPASVDPDAVPQIATGNQRHHQPTGDGLSELIGEDTNTESAAGSPEGSDVSMPHLPSLPLGVAIIRPANTALSVTAEPIHVTEGIGESMPSVVDTSASDSGPIRTLPTTPVPVAAPKTTEPADGTGQPVLVDKPNATALSPAPATGVMPTSDTTLPRGSNGVPLDSVGIPLLTVDPDAKTSPGPVAGVRVDLPPLAGIDPGHNVPVKLAPAAPATPGIPPHPAQPRPVLDRGMPAIPVPMDAPDSRQVTTPQSMVELVSDKSIGVNGPRQAVAASTPMTTNEPAVPIARDGGTVETPALFAPSMDAGTPTATFVQNTADITRPQASALAERVMQAIDLQRTQPPPRSMIIDIPEIAGMRLIVSIQSNGQVHVAPTGGSANQDTLTPFMDDLSRVLAERGFEMAGDERRRGYNPQSEEEPAPFRPRQATRQRPVGTDNDLRI